jgi:hypothetical protein
VNNKWVIAFSVFAIVALGLTIFGVVTHEENGLMQVCWNGNQALYEERLPDDFVCPQELEALMINPDYIPLLVMEHGPTNHRNAVTQALISVNRQMGGTLLQPIELPEHGLVPPGVDVTVLWGFPINEDSALLPKGALMTTTHTRDELGHISAVIRVRSGIVSGEIVKAGLVEELGHVLGLDHDSFGAMEKDTSEMRFSDSDKKLIRNLYL